MKEKYIAIIEALLFTAKEMISLQELAGVVDITPAETKKYISILSKKYEDNSHGLLLKEYNGKYILTTKPCFSSYIKDMHNLTNKVKLSRAALETLAIIAYKQPVTRAEIEDIRGVKAEKTLITLNKYNLIKELGRKDTIGNPIVYGTSEEFLRHFDLKNLSELPEVVDSNNKTEQ